ncbi:MAG: hypothetical protein AB7I01_00180 [Gammaproteobacteria bacterium]
MSATSAARPWLALVIAFCLLLALLAEAPHLADDPWEDEAATLLRFGSHPPLEAFREYRLPNNHMLFSAALAAWWSRGDSVLHARLLPAGVWLVSMALMISVGRRSFGWPATALGLALWSGAALTAAFAVALRGYAFAWPCVLVMLACAPAWVARGAWRAGVGFILAAAVSLLVLPTNVMAVAACLLWALLGARPPRALPPLAAWGRAALAGGVAALALLVYLPHRAQIAAFVAHGFSQWSTAQVMAGWTLASTGQFWPLAPLLLWGAWRARQDEVARRALELLCALASVAALVVALSPTPLVPRALVPLLPAWCLALGGLLYAAVRGALERWSLATGPLLAVLALLCFACGRVLPPCAGLERGLPPGDHVCRQYYREGYHPVAMLSAIAERFPAVPVLMAPRESFALAFARWNSGERRARLLDANQWQRHYPDRLPTLVVAASPEAARAILAKLVSGPPRDLERVLDGGGIALFAPRWP